MTWLVLGLLLWSVPHLFKRIAPDARERLGDKFKGVVALLVVAGIVLMVIGYRSFDYVPVWTPPSWGMHLTDLLMLFSVALFGLGNSKSRLRKKLRHPMLLGVIVWAGAHLLVNGDLASVVLFGGMAVWAVASIFMINARQPEWAPYVGGSVAGDVRLALITAAVYAVIGGIHMWIGPSPFPV
ncbi:NnrU family protein [Actibacterium lipolyticum]|uniref:NnrU protein n=1 Tax=Actibacterium lipolyticum TaxID=1524263 RepID=A0A238JLS4_9RHOB|nr:NnrU family protein [Actibacterium lipolyticum]SMX31144.1 NnrU protein [Actibacterium lipolyticum]